MIIDRKAAANVSREILKETLEDMLKSHTKETILKTLKKMKEV